VSKLSALEEIMANYVPKLPKMKMPLEKEIAEAQDAWKAMSAAEVERNPALRTFPPTPTADDAPLTAAIANNKKLPLTASSPEELAKLEELMVAGPDKTREIAKEIVAPVSAKKELEMETNFAEKALKGADREDATPVLNDIFNPTGESTSLVGKGFNALGYAQRKALNAIANQIGATGQSPVDSEKSSQAIVERAAEKLGIPETSTAGNMAKAFGVGALEVFADPLGLPFSKIGKLGKAAGILKAAEHTAPAAKLASDSRKAEAVKKALGLFNKNAVAADVGQAMKQAVPTVQEDVQKLVNAKRAEEAMKVLNYKSTEPTMAQKLATRGAPVVKPVGPIIRSK